jgi:hypothetical protein
LAPLEDSNLIKKLNLFYAAKHGIKGILNIKIYHTLPLTIVPEDTKFEV